MKKLFAILAVVAFVFAACGTKNAENVETTDSTVVDTPVVEEVVVDTTVCDSAAAVVTEVVAE